MRRIAVLIAVAAWCSSSPSYALDGMVITSIQGMPSYLGMFSSGKLVKYEIKNDYVVAVDSLRVDSAGAPRINMSGTYVAYFKWAPKTSQDWWGRKLVIQPIYGSTQTKEFAIEDGATWLWWVNDGSMFYTVDVRNNPSLVGQSKVRKITFSKVNGQPVMKDVFWAKLDYPIQGGFVGISGTGEKIGYSSGEQKAQTCTATNCVYGITGGWIMNGDTTKWIGSAATESQGGSGCGWTVSVSGDRFMNWIGGHNVASWLAWGTVPCADCGAVAFTELNSKWAIYRSTDPESKLEYRIGGDTAWKKNPIGVCGADNIWSCNSEVWNLTEIGVYWIDYGADCYNMIALSPKWKKAINVTKIMPWKPHPSRWGNATVMDGEVRGISFPDTSHGQLSADRGCLWVANQEDVYAPLLHFVQDRQTDNLYWSDLLGLPPSQIPPVGVSLSTTKRADGSVSFLKRRSGVTVKMPSDAAYVIDIMDIAGRSVTTLRVHGSSAALPYLKTGSYVVKVRQPGMTRSERIAVY